MVKKEKIKRKTKKEQEEFEEETEDKEDEDSESKDQDLDLEEEVLDNDSVDLQHLIRSWSRTPVLGQIDIAPQIANLEQWATTQPIQNQNNNGEDVDKFKYSGGSSSEDETKYVSVQKEIDHSRERNVDFSKVGRDTERHFDQRGMFTSTWNSMNADSNVEKYDTPENVDMAKIGREKPGEIKKYDPKLPSY